MNKDICPVPFNAEYCVSSDYQCKHIIIPTSNSFSMDRCVRFGGKFIDRDNRQRAVRLIECKAEWLNNN